jgi:hypothetical protein
MVIGCLDVDLRVDRLFVLSHCVCLLFSGSWQAQPVVANSKLSEVSKIQRQGMRGQKGNSLHGASHAGNLRYDVDSSQTGARWPAVHSTSVRDDIEHSGV